MKKRAIKVLVTGVGGNIGQGIMKALRMTKFSVKVIGTDMEPLSVGLQRSDRGYVTAPAAKPVFVSQIIKICRKEKCDLVIPGSDTELPYLAYAKKAIERESSALVLVANPALVHNLDDKWLTYLFSKETGVPHPETILPESKRILSDFLRKTGYPVLVKPRIGYGSRGVFAAANRNELDVFIARTSQPIVQQIIGSADQEYTAAAFVSPHHDIRGPILFHRVISAGATYKAEVIRHRDMEKQIVEIVQRLGVTGPCNIQYRLVKKRVIPFEFNLRYSGTTPMRAALGFNDIEMGIESFLFGKTPALPHIKQGVILRYWNEVICPDASFKTFHAASDGLIRKISSKIVQDF